MPNKRKPRRRGGPPPPGPVQRVRLPRDNEGEVLAVAVQMLGHDRVRAKCMDGHVRVCRIRGKMKKRVWIRPNDILIVVPWEFQTDEKADIVWRYSRGEADYLRRKGFVVD